MTIKASLIALAVSVGVSVAGAAVAEAGSEINADTAGDYNELDVGQDGPRNRTNVYVRGDNSRIRSTTEGADNETYISKFGFGGDLDVYVRGWRQETHVFSGPCPQGTSPQRIKSSGIDSTLVRVARCN